MFVAAADVVIDGMGVTGENTGVGGTLKQAV